MVSVLASSVIDCGYELRSCQTKEYKIGICCFSAKNSALRRKCKDWLARNQNNVAESSDISTQWLLLAHLAKDNVSFYHHLAPVVRRLSFVVCRPLNIHILIFSSETPQSNEVELSRKHQAVLVSNWSILSNLLLSNGLAKWIWVITKLPNSKQSSKGKVKTHKYHQIFFTDESYQYNSRWGVCGDHVCQRIGMEWAIFIEDLP
jgi:hypothetical protein